MCEHGQRPGDEAAGIGEGEADILFAGVNAEDAHVYPVGAHGRAPLPNHHVNAEGHPRKMVVPAGVPVWADSDLRWLAEWQVGQEDAVGVADSSSRDLLPDEVAADERHRRARGGD